MIYPQSSNLLECPEFREYILYVGQGNMDDSDLPKCTSMTDLIKKLYHEEMGRIFQELRNSTGRISFSMDLWSDTNLRSFMAVTAHYIYKDEKDGGRLKYRCGLIAFCYVPGDHTGVNLADHFLKILVKLNITHKVRKLPIHQKGYPMLTGMFIDWCHHNG